MTKEQQQPSPSSNPLEIFAGNANGINPIELPTSHTPGGFQGISYAAIVRHVEARQRPGDAILYFRVQSETPVVDLSRHIVPKTSAAVTNKPALEQEPGAPSIFAFADDRIVIDLAERKLLVD